MRIDKFLANQDIGSRSQVKQYIKKGMISVNGIVCKSPEQKIDENADQICSEVKDNCVVQRFEFELEK